MHYGSSKNGQDSVVCCQQGEHPFNQTVTYPKYGQTCALYDSITELTSEVIDIAQVL